MSIWLNKVLSSSFFIINIKHDYSMTSKIAMKIPNKTTGAKTSKYRAKLEAVGNKVILYAIIAQTLGIK